MGRYPSTISQELRRNAATRGAKLEYRATVAQRKALVAAKRPKPAKLATNDRLCEYVRERLAVGHRRFALEVAVAATARSALEITVAATARCTHDIAVGDRRSGPAVCGALAPRR